MSLFGEPSPTESAPATSKSLFENEPAAASSTSLFDDDANGSPWSMPTPKKQARQNLLKSLLPATDVPESYVDAFDTVVEDEGSSAVSYETVESILRSCSLNSADQTRIIGFVASSGRDNFNPLGRSEFNVLLALIGLAQEGEELSLDSVDERRRRLPQPRIPFIGQLQSKTKQQQQQQQQQAPPAEAPKAPPPKQQKPRQDSFSGDPTVDPWGTPSNKRVPAPSTAAPTMQEQNGFGDTNTTGSLSNGVERTTSAFTTHSTQDNSSGGSPTVNRQASSMAGGAWGSYNGGSIGFSEQSTLGGGFGGSGEDGPNEPGHRSQPSVGASVVIPPGTGESVTVTLLPGKEGMFLFQHHNYEVKTIRRGSSVIRRYSDFVWLLDCLQKRYPFRRLPLLPPKRLQVNGTHLAGDISGFLEKRRRGLVRFSNQLVQHPVLSQETLVVMFLTVPTELAVWRKQATISVQEEFAGKVLPPTLEDSLPSTLSELFEQVRAGVKRSAEVYINLCVLLERLVKRNEGLAADSSKFSLALQSLTDSSKDTYSIDPNDVPLLNDGINAVSKHLSSTQTLLEDEGQAWDQNTLEDLKTIRDSMVSMRDVFDRRDRYARDNIPQLERRIEASEAKLQQLRGKPPSTIKPGEIEKVESSIISDKESIVQQHARGVFIKECLRDEIVTFQSTIHSISRFHQEWAQERVKYAELQASNWRQLVDSVESMPLGE